MNNNLWSNILFGSLCETGFYLGGFSLVMKPMAFFCSSGRFEGRHAGNCLDSIYGICLKRIYDA